MSAPGLTSTAVFGASDGLVASVALILATYRHGSTVVVVALLGLLVAEGLGMAASEYLSDADTDLKRAGVMGVATSLAIILPCVPWFLTGGNVALGSSLGIALVLAGAIAHLRPGRWQRTWAQTFVILLAVSALATLAGHLT